MDGSLAFGVFLVVFSAFTGFDFGEDFLASSGASFSDFLEFVLERFGGGETGLSGEAARLREGILRALGRGFSGAFSAGGAGFADAARDDRLGGIAERRQKSQQDVCNCHRPAPLNSQSHVTSRVIVPYLFKCCSATLSSWHIAGKDDCANEQEDKSSPANYRGCFPSPSPKTCLQISHTHHHRTDFPYRLSRSADIFLA